MIGRGLGCMEGVEKIVKGGKKIVEKEEGEDVC